MKRTRNIHRGIGYALHRIQHGYEKQPAKNKAVFWVVVLSVALLVGPAYLTQRRQLNPSKLYYMNPPQQISVGQSFPLEVRLQTTGTAINAVQTVVRFNPLYLEVVGITTEKSFCTYYLENTFDNMRGSIRVACGTPNPGFTGDSVVFRATVRAKIAGNTSITLDEKETDVLANDGKGSSVLHDRPKLPLTIIQLF